MVLDKRLEPLVLRLQLLLAKRVQVPEIRGRDICAWREFGLARNTLLDWENLELRARERLVLICSCRPVVAEVVGVPGLHGDLDLLVEANRVWEVPAVADLIIGHVFFVDDGATKWISIFLHAPALGEIILSSGTVHTRRPRVVVDEDHIVALAPPCALEMCYRVIAADVGACTFSLEDHVVIFSVDVRNLGFEAIRLNIRRSPAVGGVFTAPVGVEEQGVLTQGGLRVIDFVIDVEVLDIGIIALDFDLDASVFVERYWEIAIESRHATKLLLLGGFTETVKGSDWKFAAME
jgi:hypothetical protein